jgi:hypothetical protein
MKLEIAYDGFVHRGDEPRFFVMRLASDDVLFEQGYRFEVQFLDEAGHAGASVYLAADEPAGTIDDYTVTDAVHAAASRQAPEQGDYVDSTGESQRPF